MNRTIVLIKATVINLLPLLTNCERKWTSPADVDKGSQNAQYTTNFSAMILLEAIEVDRGH